MSSMSSITSMEIYQNILKTYRKKNILVKVADNLKCLRCSQILINSTQTNCGCRYCKECIDDYLKDGSKACLGGDCGIITNIFPDHATNRDIYKLKVKCHYDGCDHEEMLKDIGPHLEKCVFQTVNCPKCDEEHVKNKLRDHLMNSCKMREVKCVNCGEFMTWEKLNEIHLKIDKEELCPCFEGPCPYECSVKGNVNVKNHRKVCEKKPIICPYSEIGCIEIITEENRNDHMVKSAFTHSEYTFRRFKEIQDSNLLLQNTLENLLKEFDFVKKEMNKTKRELEIIKAIKPPPTATGGGTTILSNAKNDDKTIYRNGTYIWKIEHFSDLKRSAERGEKISITSDPFYTKEFGYKMSMKIYPAGDGVGKSTHLSVFFTLMRGDFDDLLPWPFKNKVTLTILDQINKTSDHSDTFKPDPRSTCYQQPTDEYNIASGSPKFISFSQLFDSYIKNDTIFLKIQILN